MEKFINPIDQLIYTTVRIECNSHLGSSSGSGYFYQFQIEDHPIPCIVTNKHVIASSIQGRFHLSMKDKNGKADLNNHIPIEIRENFESCWILHPDTNIDLAIMPLAPLFRELEAQDINPYFCTLCKNNIADLNLLNTLSNMEDIIMIGYPNGLWDQQHNHPIIRKGITATHPKLSYNNKPEFLIDAACFPGSSGSPVFLANIGSFVNSDGVLCAGSRIALLGTLYAGPQHTTTGEIVMMNIPTTPKPVSISSIPNNLGLVIHVNKLNEFEEILRTKFFTKTSEE